MYQVAPEYIIIHSTVAVEKELKSVVSSLVTTSEQASKTTATEAGKVVICHTPLQVLTIAVHVYLLSN